MRKFIDDIYVICCEKYSYLEVQNIVIPRTIGFSIPRALDCLLFKCFFLCLGSFGLLQFTPGWPLFSLRILGVSRSLRQLPQGLSFFCPTSTAKGWTGCSKPETRAIICIHKRKPYHTHRGKWLFQVDWVGGNTPSSDKMEGFLIMLRRPNNYS